MIDPLVGISFPQFRSGDESVLLFNSKLIIKLNTQGAVQWFSSHGNLFDLQGNQLVSSSIVTALPTAVNAATAGYLLTFPEQQPGPPYDVLPVNLGPNTPLPAGEIPPGSYTKQFYDFGNGNTLVFEGPAFPKLAILKDGGAQFWVGFVGAVTQGEGQYAGAKGMAAFNGSATFPAPFPQSVDEIAQLLEQGFPANVTVSIKVVLKDQLF